MVLIVRTQLLFNGPGLKLGSQLICKVGLEFLTKGSSLSSILITLLNLHELPPPPHPPFKFLSLDSVFFSSLSPSPPSTNRPFSLLTPSIYRLRLVGCAHD